MTAKILTLDIERQGALMDEVWEGRQYNTWIGPERVIEPSRTICLAYRWEHEGRTRFIAEWEGDLEQDNASPTPGGGHHNMIMQAHRLFDEADYIVGWNSKSFDVKHLRAAFYAYNLLPPSPHVDIDLMKQCASQFAFPAKSLAYVTKLKGMEGKLKTEKHLRRKLRYADGDVLHKARAAMRRYNIRDVNQTREVFHDMLPWLTGMNVGLYNVDGELRCSNCGSDNLHSRGTARRLSYAYGRYQCQDCGKWVKDTRSFAKTDLVGI